MLLDTRVEKKSEGVLEVHCKVAKDFVSQKLNGALNVVQGQAALKGFRKGKAPLHMIKKLYDGQIKYETLNKIVPEVYEKVIAEQKIKPIRMPEFSGLDNMKEGEDLEISFTVEVMPEIEEFGSYEGLTIKKVEYDYSADEMMEKELEMLKNTQANYSAIDGKIEAGDFIRAKYSIVSDNGEKTPEKSIYFMIKEMDPYYVISKNFIGKAMKETGIVDVDFPKEFVDTTLAGTKKKVEFTIEEGKRLVYPEMNDEFAKGFKQDTIAALKETIKKNIEKKMQEQNLLATADQIYEKILSTSKFSIAPSIVMEQSQSDLTKKVNEIIMQGKNIDQYLADEKLDRDGFIEKVKQESAENIKKFLVVEKISKEKNIEVKDEDVKNFIQEIKNTEVVNQDKIEEYYAKNKEAKESLRERIKFIKVAEYLISQVKVSGTQKKKVGEK